MEYSELKKAVYAYCSIKHAPKQVPCQSCSDLLKEAELNRSTCSYGEEFPCRVCPTPCFSEESRLMLREIMTFYFTKRRTL